MGKIKNRVIALTAALGLGIAAERGMHAPEPENEEVKMPTRVKKIVQDPIETTTVHSEKRLRELSRVAKRQKSIDGALAASLLKKINESGDDEIIETQREIKIDSAVESAIKNLFPDVKIIEQGDMSYDSGDHSGEVYLRSWGKSGDRESEVYDLFRVIKPRDVNSEYDHSKTVLVEVMVEKDGTYTVGDLFGESNGMNISCDAKTLPKVVEEFATFHSLIEDDYAGPTPSGRMEIPQLIELRKYYEGKLGQIDEAETTPWEYLSRLAQPKRMIPVARRMVLEHLETIENIISDMGV